MELVEVESEQAGWDHVLEDVGCHVKGVHLN